jgi:methylated-DNA-[protein]-cysteine S-methyltransferase
MNYVYETMKSPMGELKLVGSERGLAAILWEDDDPLRVRLEAGREDKQLSVLVEAERQLNEYFAGKRKAFSVALDFVGTPFQQKVWRALLSIPWLMGGDRCLAIPIGSPGGVNSADRDRGRGHCSGGHHGLPHR